MTEWVTFLYALLPHPTQPLVLVQGGSDGIALPNKVCADKVWVPDTLVLKPLLEEMRHQGKQDQYKLVPFVFTNVAHKIEQVLNKLAR